MFMDNEYLVYKNSIFCTSYSTPLTELGSLSLERSARTAHPPDLRPLLRPKPR